ncbi:MAG: Extracellular serine protease precursor [Lentisphaerae bacterium ADurb.BinA184]|nr:MAG: Extracellular serine protease precursor [Lentisphaerae bacterium ADurb.BinA184]
MSSAGSNYTGKSFIYNGTLEVASLANLSANSSLGAPTTVANGTIDLGSATLRYIGSGASTTNRVVNLLASGNLDASGSGSVTFTSAVTGTGQNLALLGSGAGELSAGVGTGSGGTLVKSGSGTWTVGGTSTYTGETHVLQGTLVVDGSIATSSRVTVTAGATLAGSGTVPLIANAGLVSPGDSPGILTTTQADPTLGTDYAFELTATGSPTYGNPTASVNDVLRMTDAGTPFVVALDADNAVGVYLGVATLTTGDLFRGGWYTDRGSDFIADISGAAFDYFVLGDGNGTHGFNGTDYYTLAELYGAGASVAVSTVAEVADFGGGDVNGYVTLFNVSVGVIPEPATLGVLLLGAAGVALRRRRGVAGA